MLYQSTHKIDAFRLGYEHPPQWWMDMIAAKKVEIILKDNEAEIIDCVIKPENNIRLGASKGDWILRNLAAPHDVYVMDNKEFSEAYVPALASIVANAEMLEGVDVDSFQQVGGAISWIRDEKPIPAEVIQQIEKDQAEHEANLEVLIQQLPVPATIEEAIAYRNAWYETALQHCKNEEYYRGLVWEIGNLLGEPAYTGDDGIVQQDVICAKVPELVAAELSLLGAMHADIERLNTEIDRVTRQQQGPASERRLSGRGEDGQFPVCTYCERRHDIRVGCPEYVSRNGD